MFAQKSQQNPINNCFNYSLNMKKYRLLFLFLFLCFIPLLLFRDFTPSNELRYLSIADEAIRNGHWFILTNHGIPYTDKPPFYFWVVMLGRQWFGLHCMWFIGLFSMIPALMIVAVMIHWCQNELDANKQITASLMLFTTAYFIGTALVLRMDMLMSLFITLALYTFYQWYCGTGNRNVHRWFFPLFILLGIYTKAFMGFLIPFVSVLVFLAWKRKLSSFHTYWGWRTWLVIVAGLLVWFGCVYAEGGYSYLYDMVVGQSIQRSVHVSQHKKPFYYYAYYLTYTVAPWTIYYLSVFFKNINKKRHFTDKQQFFSIIIISTFIMLSCFGSKLEVYLVPILPFIAFLALLLTNDPLQWTKWTAFSAELPAFILVFAFPVYIFLLFLPSFSYYSPFFIIATAFITYTAVVSIWFSYRQRDINKGIRVMATGICFAIFAGSFGIPALNNEIGYTQLANKALDIAKVSKTNEYYTYDIRRAENLDVYFGKNVHKTAINELTSDSCLNNLLLSRNKCLEDTAFLQAIKGRKVTRYGQYLLIFPARR